MHKQILQFNARRVTSEGSRADVFDPPKRRACNTRGDAQKGRRGVGGVKCVLSFARNIAVISARCNSWSRQRCRDRHRRERRGPSGANLWMIAPPSGLGQCPRGETLTR